MNSGWWWAGILASIAVALVAGDRTVDYALAQVPLPPEVKLPQSARVYDRHGNLIATYRDEVTRFIIDTAELPDRVRNAVIAAEDRNFFQHEGVSLGGIVRAAWRNVTSGAVEQGGSTITQQYVKNAVLDDSSRTLERKVDEAILAIKLERRYSKDKILEMYLNTVYFGRGAYGIEAAARTYFAKHADQLTLAEASYLAGLIPSPARYSTGEAAKARRAYVLGAMKQEGYITAARAEKALDAKLRKKRAPQLRRRKQDAAYFVEWLRKEYLYPRFGDCLYRCGLKIYTTIDAGMQKAAEKAVRSTLNEKGDPEAALVSMTPRGHVRAMVGSRRHFHRIKKARGFNFATDGGRHAGSAFKPFTLLAAIEEGISLKSRFSGHTPKEIDDPVCAGPEGMWEPENYEGSSFGTIDLTAATTSSVNTVYAELITEVGPDKVADLLEDLGFSGEDSDDVAPVCSLALGTLDVTPLEMARAYAALAARGRLPVVRPIRYVENGNGRCVLGFGSRKVMKKQRDCRKIVETEGEQVVEPNSVDVLTQALTNVVEAGTATGAQIGRPVAGKTGTTQDNRDAWFAGYVPQLATVVWMGHRVEKGPDGKAGTSDDISPLMRYCSDPRRCRPVHGIDVTGGSFPAAIWSAFMRVALEGVDVATFPTPYYTPSRVINPPPPPPPKKEEKPDERGKPEKTEDIDEGGPGNGNGNGKNKDDD
ncbi:MAG TPA: transglycosylase domain-containing protein [Actinomycetota bacterium]|nr:transglycosylase domain-containing protein [Actinomycetota bacterium]